MRTTYEIRGLQASKCGTGKIVEWSNGVKRGLSYFLKCFLEGVQICDNVSNEYHAATCSVHLCANLIVFVLRNFYHS